MISANFFLDLRIRRSRRRTFTAGRNAAIALGVSWACPPPKPPRARAEPIANTNDTTARKRRFAVKASLSQLNRQTPSQKRSSSATREHKPPKTSGAGPPKSGSHRGLRSQSWLGRLCPHRLSFRNQGLLPPGFSGACGYPRIHPDFRLSGPIRD